MMLRDQHLPFAAREVSHALLAPAGGIEDDLVAGSAIDVSAGVDGVGEHVVDGGVARLDPSDLAAWCIRSGNLSPSERNHSHTRRAEPVSANWAKTWRMAVQTASSGWKQTSPSSSPQTKPTGRPRRSSPRAALLRMPPLRRARSMCNSASLMVPFKPSNNLSLNTAG